MWRAFKLLLFLWPIAVMGYYISSNIAARENVDEKLSDPNSLEWGSGDEKISFQVTQTASGEQEGYEIKIIGDTGQVLSTDEFVIDWDMFGGGFIKAVQIDDDQELELIAWGNHEGKMSYLLDYSDGQVIKKINSDTFPEDVRELTKQWHQAHVGQGMFLFLLTIFVLVYYVLLGIIAFIVWVVARRRSRTIKT